MKKKIALVLAVVLLMVATVGGTLAWLTAKSDTVTNTFTTSDISVTLAETKTDFKMIPGYTIEKDPKAKVESGSEFCWLFVKIDESSNLGDYIEYTVDSNWTQLTEDSKGNAITDKVYYRKIDTADKIGVQYSVLANDKVTVKGTVTKTMMEGLKATGAVQPTLTFTAYASQLYKNNNVTDNEFTAAKAWDNITTK